MILGPSGYVDRLDSVDLAVLRLHRTAPDAPGASAHRADRLTIVVANLLNAGSTGLSMFGAASGRSRRRARLRAGHHDVPLVHGRTLLLALGWRDVEPYLSPWRANLLDPRPLARMLGLGSPIGVQIVLEIGVFGRRAA